MSSDYIFDCAKTFEELYSKANEKLELLKTQKNKEDELNKVKDLLSQMENTLNTIELESSLMNNKTGGSNEYNITQTCRQHFNEIRKRFNKTDNDFCRRSESTALKEIKIDGDFKYSNDVNDLEHLQSRYGGDFPLNDNMIPEELKRLRRREIIKARVLMGSMIFIVLFVLFKIFR